MRRAFGALTAAVLAFASVGCDDGQPAEPTPDQGVPSQDPGPADQSYTTRGTIQQLSLNDGRTRSVAIYHEPIPEFVNRQGKVEGMPAMSMTFTVLDEALLEGLDPGDRIEFGFEVRWDASPQLLLTDVEVLAEAEADDEGESPDGADSGSGGDG